MSRSSGKVREFFKQFLIFLVVNSLLALGFCLGWKICESSNGFDQEDGRTTETAGSGEELELYGAMLNDVATYEIGKYINFTIPYGWNVGKVDVQDAATIESIAVTGKSVAMTVSLRNVEPAKNIEGMNWALEGLIYDLSNKYPTYTFEKYDMIAGKVGVIGINVPNTDDKFYMAITGVQDKTLVINYSYSSEDFIDAELYFTISLAEMAESCNKLATK